MHKSTITYKNKFDQENFMDDPFNLGKTGSNAVVTNKSQEARLFEFVNDLVAQYAKHNGCNYSLFLSDLSKDDQNKLVALYIDYTGRELTECVNGNDFSIDNDYTCALLMMMHNNCQETREKFAETVQANINAYYEKSLDNLLTEACMEYEYSMHQETGYRMIRDDETGYYDYK